MTGVKTREGGKKRGGGREGGSIPMTGEARERETNDKRPKVPQKCPVGHTGH